MAGIPRLREYSGLALLSYGFRPFFLMGAIYAALAVLIWLALFSGRIELPSVFIPRDWHVHEMLYGFVPAVVTGFLLTAIPNWTGRLPIQGLPLLALLGTWIAGRVAVRVLAGEPEAAKSAGEEALPLLEARLRERPDDTLTMTGLSWVYLALGRNTDALRLSRQAADTISIEKDALAGPIFQNGLAQIEARAGAPEEAIKRLRRLLSIPAGGAASIARLKIDPVWDPIRNRPDFHQLLAGPEQIGPNK